MTADPRQKRSLWWLSLGAAGGLALAAFGLLERDGAALFGGGDALPRGAVARVNGALIRAEDYQRLLSGVENDTRQVADAALQRRVLDRMIDEELLVQRALDLGLARVDRRVRANLVSSLIASVTAEAETEEPDADELSEFYEAERGFFTQPGRLHVRQAFFRVRNTAEDAGARERAESAVRRLRAGEPLEVVRAELADAEVSPIPDGLLPAQKLLEYVGPTALRASMDLEDGALSDPVRSGTGYHVLLRVASEPARLPELDAITDLVRAEWTRRAGDRALREYLDELREDARIVE
jgi:parvulin-like peptidyl-prolyl isomerase